MKKQITMMAGIMLVGCMVIACGTSGTGAGIDPNTSTTASAVPSVPTGAVASASGANQATVTWQPVTGATSYNLYWSTASGVTTTTGTKIANASPPYAHNGLSAATTYYYIVTAVNSAGESAPSGQASIASVAVTAAPAGVSAAGGANQTAVTWQPVTGATSYNIYWSTLSGVTKSTGTKIAGAATPHVHSGLSANTTYYYIVTAVNSVGESVASSQASATTDTVSGVAPAVPSGIAAVSGTNKVTVSWNAVSGATSYNIYWSNEPTHVMKDMGAVKITGVTSPYRHTNLIADTDYAYVVTALNASGESLESAIAPAKTPVIDGVALHAVNCANCHGALATSSKKGRSAAQIQSAINNNSGGMASLSALSAAQVQAIADVLGL